MPRLLTLVPKSDPGLRTVIPVITNFNDAILKEVIADMLYSIEPAQLKAVNAPFESAAGMAANQWGIQRRVCLFSPSGAGPHSPPPEVLINPSYKPFVREGEASPCKIKDWEGCFSVPLAAGLINRYQAIIATYYTVDGAKIEKLLEDFPARVFQHETDHLDGKLYDGLLDNHSGPECCERKLFSNCEALHTFWLDIVKPNREK